MRLFSRRAVSDNIPAEAGNETVLVTGADCHPFSAGVAADWDYVHAWRSLPLGEPDQAADPTHHQQVGSHLSRHGFWPGSCCSRLPVAGCAGDGLWPGNAAALTVNSPITFLFCGNGQCQAISVQQNM